MNVTDLLNQLTQQGIHLWAEGDKLKFRAPKGALTDEQRALLKTHKAEILKILSEPKTCPASFAQQRLWFLYQMEPNVPFYNIPLVFELIGDLDKAALTKTLNEIVRRHETLRTTFCTVDEELVQVIAPYHPFDMPLIDLRTLPEAERAAEEQRHIEAETEQPFDLSCDSLVRFNLLRLADTRYRLLLTMHHIISDGWSLRVLYREITALYTAFVHSQPSPLPELPLQYADFSRWQRDWFQGERAEDQLAYWQKQLAGSLPTLDLPTDHPRPPVQTFRGGWHAVTTSQSLLESLKALSLQENATLFMTLLAAFKILLYHYTQQTDILVGIPIANRIRADIEPLIGFFVNTLVLRSDLSNNLTFRNLLQAVRQTALDAQTHQDLPFEKLVEVLQPDRNLSHSPLFQVMFSLQSMGQPPVELPGLTLHVQNIDDGSAKFDLSLTMTETETGLQIHFQYNIDLFEAETIERMVGHYQTLLAGIVADPDTPIAQLPLLTEAEQHQLLIEWNNTQVNYPQNVCIHQLFEAQAEERPEAIAVVYGEEQLSYAELNERANQLGHYLHKHGVATETLVGLFMERSIEMLIGMLGVLKAGGTYVPIDPSYPEERITYILEDTQMPVLLMQQHLLERLPENEAYLVCLDRDWAKIAAEERNPPEIEIKSENLVYVIYTSGSTGKPKGVMIEHNGLVNLICWHQQRFNITTADQATQLASLSFDAAAWEIWPYLTAGATLHLPPNEEIRLSPKHLRDWLIAQRITLTFVPTPLTEQLINLDWPNQVSLRAVLTGGDKLHIYPAPTLPFTLINNYGPTEYTVVTTSTTIPATTQYDHPPSIGRPINNTQVYILDKYLQPVPVGIPGELHISGIGLARGYLNRPELTTEKFIPNPFNQNPDARLYKTGDLACYLPDGNIEFLGRADHQVKVRGNRIELGEIEAVLGQHHSVREAVVIVREDMPDDKRLTAYLVLNQEESPTVSELRRHVREKLPDHMTPSVFMMLETLPLTPNGKVDRRALPVPDTARPELAATFVAPEGPVEEMLAEVWQEILGVEQIGIHDNFFELGGHSLLAIQIVSRLFQHHEIELPLRYLFEYPTIAELAPIIEQLLLA